MEVTDDLDKASCGGEMTGMGQREWRREIGDSEKKFCFAEVFCRGKNWESSQRGMESKEFLFLCFVCFLKMRDIKLHLKATAYDLAMRKNG